MIDPDIPTEAMPGTLRQRDKKWLCSSWQTVRDTVDVTLYQHERQ
jgi:hypothetical protein